MLNIKVKDNKWFYHFKSYVIMEAYQMLPIAHWLIRVQVIVEDMQVTYFFYELWTIGALLNILLGPPNHNSQSSLDETH